EQTKVRSTLKTSRDGTMALRIPTFSLISMILLIVFAPCVTAQCPGGRPALPNGNCPPLPRPPRLRRPPPPPPPPVVRASPSCSIMIQVDKISGGRAGNVNLSVNGKRNGIWKTDGSGIFTLRGLTCGSSYEITPANSDLKFGPQSSTIANLKGQEKIAFLAIVR